MYRQLFSTISADGQLELALHEVETPEPQGDQVLVRVQAAPINPSDLGAVFGPADMRGAQATGEGADRTVTAQVPDALVGMVAPRAGIPVPVGNEGAGEVIAAGDAPAAQALLGKTVAVLGRAMYAQLHLTTAGECLVLPDGVTAAQGASCFVNPLTALGMVDTMRLEGHHGLVHTAAASNLGQMLLRLCLADGVPLVNVVRRAEQVDALTAQGATHVCNSSDGGFADSLTEAVADTDATIGFDATGGGTLASDLLAAMERAQARKGATLGGYGSATHKQVYIYGGLDRSETVLRRNFGMAWGIGGWLLPLFLGKVGEQRADELRRRVADEITTTFASDYTQVISLADMLDPEVMAAYGRMATGEKYLVDPSRALDA